MMMKQLNFLSKTKMKNKSKKIVMDHLYFQKKMKLYYHKKSCYHHRELKIEIKSYQKKIMRKVLYGNKQ
jgi:hypothetical protein